MKKVGYIDGVPVYEDPNAPPGKVYFLNSDYMVFEPLGDEAYGAKFSRWYRIKRYLKRPFNALFR